MKLEQCYRISFHLIVYFLLFSGIWLHENVDERSILIDWMTWNLEDDSEICVLLFLTSWYIEENCQERWEEKSNCQHPFLVLLEQTRCFSRMNQKGEKKKKERRKRRRRRGEKMKKKNLVVSRFFFVSFLFFDVLFQNNFIITNYFFLSSFYVLKTSENIDLAVFYCARCNRHKHKIFTTLDWVPVLILPYQQLPMRFSMESYRIPVFLKHQSLLQRLRRI